MTALHQFWDINNQTFCTMLEARFRPPARDGLKPHEHDLSLAGDSLIDPADVTLNRAVNIAAPASRVWPWLAQMMRGAGMYGWTAVESSECRSAHHVIDTLPEPRAGDALDDLLFLTHVESGRELVWHCPRALGVLNHEVREFSLDYLLMPVGSGQCRLMSRLRGRCDHVTNQVGRYLLEVVDFVLPAHQLVTVKSLAETHTRHRSNGQARAAIRHHQALELIPAVPGRMNAVPARRH